ncbi:MAG: Zn-dependent alcohol dehydrogenase [Caldilineaceae bacterium]|nr:Zn-dependent alcohol dehydrogenase [Caldilineaceae bacterium]
MKMKAAVCYEFGKPLVVEEVEIDPPQAGEVRVRVAACAICHSDVHEVRGEWGGTVPVVSGHEAAGVIEAVGPGVTRVKPGEPVVLSLLRQCGECYYCTIGKPFCCEKSFPLDTESRLRNRDGLPLRHGIRTAAFAEYAVVDQTQVVAIPPAIPLECAALLACGVITGLGAVTNTAGVEAGSHVAIIGCGGVGLNAIQGAVLSGAAQIIAIDILDNKLAAAKAFGATHTINARQETVINAVRGLTGGRGVDYAFATVGSPRAIEQAIDLVHQSGTAVIVGMPANHEALFSINAHHMTYGRTITGSPMGSTRLFVDVPRLVQLYQEGRLKLDELITKRYPLEAINAAITAMERGEALRNVIVF